MAYRLDFAESPEASLRRAAGERVGDALRRLGDELEGDPVAAVHEARKDIKKARALLRLYRGQLDRATYRRENGVLRDAGLELSELRDDDVLRDLIAELGLSEVRLRPAGDGFETPPEMAVDAARNRLGRVLARMDAWTVAATDHRALLAGLDRSYRRGRKAFARAQRRPTDERLHDWRKRAKDLRYQQQLLRPAFDEQLKAQATAAKKLSELLGDDHDLAVLAARLESDDGGVIAARREELQAEAFRLARRVYAEPPKRFRKRIARYLAAADEDSRAELATLPPDP
jgi:CHAD domain-containing protein